MILANRFVISFFSFVVTLSSLVIDSNLRTLRGEDWPQWQGVRRDSVWNESGLVEKFPNGGIKAKWRMPVKIGYAGPAVANGRVYLTDFDTPTEGVTKIGFAKKKIEGKERVLCFDSKTGNELWQHSYDVTYDIQYPSGPRCTPTVYEGLVYTVGAEGDLRCLTADKGDLVWKKNFPTDYNTKTPVWGYTSHPLVFEETLIVLPGGKGTGVVALDRKTGTEKWRALSSDEPGYAPPTLIEHNGRKLLLIWQPTSFNAIDPKTGESFWSLDIVPDYKMPVMSARLTGDDLFVSAVENTSARIQLGSEGTKPTAKILWRGTKKNSLSTVNSSPFVENGYVYGTDVLGEFRCVKLEDGSRMWETFLPTAGVDKKPRSTNMRSGTAFVVKNGERFFIMSETGDLIIARLTPEKYEEVSRMNILAPNGTAWNRPVVWSHPAFAEKAIFARNDEEIVCVPLAAE